MATRIAQRDWSDNSRRCKRSHSLLRVRWEFLVVYLFSIFVFSAFYYSFFKKAALGGDLTRDLRAQHREQINPLKEYTILPERILAWIYRSTGAKSQSMVLWYLGNVSYFQGLLSVTLGILILKLTNVKSALLAQALFIAMGLRTWLWIVFISLVYF